MTEMVSSDVDLRKILELYELLSRTFDKPSDSALHLQCLCGLFIAVCKLDDTPLDEAVEEFCKNIRVITPQIANDSNVMGMFE